MKNFWAYVFLSPARNPSETFGRISLSLVSLSLPLPLAWPTESENANLFFFCQAGGGGVWDSQVFELTVEIILFFVIFRATSVRASLALVFGTKRNKPLKQGIVACVVWLVPFRKRTGPSGATEA